MVHTTPRTRRHTANRTRLLEAATEIVFEEGVDALSIKKVAARADYTPGALYRYFPSKEALLAAVVSARHRRVAQQTSPRSTQPPSPLASVVAQTDAYITFLGRRPAIFSLLTTMAGDARVLIDDAASARSVSGAMSLALAPLALSFDACANDGQLLAGDAKERALVLWSALQGTLQLRKQERVAPAWVDAERLARVLVHTLLLGWGRDRRLTRGSDKGLSSVRTLRRFFSCFGSHPRRQQAVFTPHKEVDMTIKTGLAIVLGALTWTLLEYCAHRWLGHVHRRNAFGAEHTRHHSQGDYFAPPWKKVARCAGHGAHRGRARHAHRRLGRRRRVYGGIGLTLRLLRSTPPARTHQCRHWLVWTLPSPASLLPSLPSTHPRTTA